MKIYQINRTREWEPVVVVRNIFCMYRTHKSLHGDTLIAVSLDVYINNTLGAVVWYSDSAKYIILVFLRKFE